MVRLVTVVLLWLAVAFAGALLVAQLVYWLGASDWIVGVSALLSCAIIFGFGLVMTQYKV